jgi:hypothetical protein
LISSVPKPKLHWLNCGVLPHLFVGEAVAKTIPE